MDDLRLHCLTLQSLVQHHQLKHSAIEQTKEIIIILMQDYIRDRKIPEINYARYKSMSHADLVFEALCHTIFDYIFKLSGTKFKHSTKEFVHHLYPFYAAKVLKYSSLDYYIQRFRLRRYSFRHRQHRYDLETAKILLSLRYV